jgi:hypothetical protein
MEHALFQNGSPLVGWVILFIGIIVVAILNTMVNTSFGFGFGCIAWAIVQFFFIFQATPGNLGVAGIFIGGGLWLMKEGWQKRQELTDN